MNGTKTTLTVSSKAKVAKAESLGKERPEHVTIAARQDIWRGIVGSKRAEAKVTRVEAKVTKQKERQVHGTQEREARHGIKEREAMRGEQREQISGATKEAKHMTAREAKPRGKDPVSATDVEARGTLPEMECVQGIGGIGQNIPKAKVDSET